MTLRRDVLSSPFYRVSVKATVHDEAGRLLVAREPDGFWELPGGGWEHGETLEQCLGRELREEVGGDLRSVDLSTVYPCTGPGRHYHRLKLIVEAELTDRGLAAGEEIAEIRWVTREQFAQLPMRDGDEVVRERALTTWPR